MELTKENKKMILKISIILSSSLFIVLILSGMCSNSSSLNQVCPRCSEDSSKCSCCKKCTL